MTALVFIVFFLLQSKLFKGQPQCEKGVTDLIKRVGIWRRAYQRDASGAQLSSIIRSLPEREQEKEILKNFSKTSKKYWGGGEKNIVEKQWTWR